MSNTYDPTKRYTWTPEDKFELSGDEFGIILNAVRAILSTPESARVLLLDKANTAIEGMMARSVEKGIVIEIPVEGPPKEQHLKVVN